MDEIMQRLGETLHLARRRQGITIKALAERTGVSATIISLLETGKRPQVSFSVVAKLARALHVSLDTVVTEGEFEAAAVA